MQIGTEVRKGWIDKEDPRLSLNEQLLLASVCKGTYYHTTTGESEENLLYMERLDKLYTAYPFYGSRRMTAVLNQEGHSVNRKRVVRLMRLMGLEALYPKPNLSKASEKDKKYPYLLRGVEIMSVNHVWSTDITYIPVRGGFLYLTAIMDWYTRYVLSLRISNTLDVGFCLEALEEALEKGKPRIFNTDQGVQYTCRQFTGALEKNQIQISMDGKGRASDNIFVERLWRTVKYEEVYLKRYENGSEAVKGLNAFFDFYNNERPHQALGYRTPSKVYWEQIAKM